MARDRLRCKSCSSQLIAWGKTSTGKKRYRCSHCHTTRIYHYSVSLDDVVLALFQQYVLWGFTYEILSSTSGYSVPYLVEQFHKLLETSPPQLPSLDQSSYAEAFLLIDGLWFTKRFVLMAYRQSRTLVLLHVSVMGNERGSKIAKDLELLKKQYRFTGIVSDGGTGIRKGVVAVFGRIPHQICLAHLHRDVINAIGRYPKRVTVQELKTLADHIWLIESKEALVWWREQVTIWVKQNNEYLKERRYDQDWNYWYIHKGARRAVAILASLHETSFKFLDHPLMPKTTNELEAQFGHLSKRWLAHRGLKQTRWEQFMKWFVYFYNQEKLS